MDEAKMKAFETEVRLHILARLVVAGAYDAARLSGQPASSVRQRLLHYLEGTSASMTADIGDLSRDPGVTALYDEVLQRVERSFVSLVKRLPEGE
jgi:hypothetical protein